MRTTQCFMITCFIIIQLHNARYDSYLFHFSLLSTVMYCGFHKIRHIHNTELHLINTLSAVHNNKL